MIGTQLCFDGPIPDLKNQTISLTFGVRFGGPRRY